VKAKLIDRLDVALSRIPREIHQQVETWVITVALENYPVEEIEKWNMPQWEDFFARLERGNP
jgi:hypothetical protein